MTPEESADLIAQDRLALESLVIDNPDLERLEQLIDRFNLFEAVGVVRQELRHSDFLSFLIDPQQAHGLGDWFLKRLLQRAVTANLRAGLPVSLIDLDVWSLSDSVVRREWRNIDVLVVNEAHRLIILIENKVDSAEHSNQLSRYLGLVQQQFPGWRVLPIYLTLDGSSPSDEAYLPVGYDLVLSVAEQLLQIRGPGLSPDLTVLLRHYTDLLRTHFVSDSEIDELCRRIYQRHKRALDLIIEKRPDRQQAIRQLLTSLILETPGLVPDQIDKSYIRFLPQEWDVASLQGGSGWTRSGRMLMFSIENLPGKLAVVLALGPGPEDTRDTVMRVALNSQPPFAVRQKRKWNHLYEEQILSAAALDGEMDEIEESVRRFWSELVREKLPLFIEALRPAIF